ncbi:FGGY-family carbohydrate kinase [Mycolicibacterium neoaurum]|uniref:xylulokinase n=1 Tax=Mycolicibacterium neoaurum TaxID=1795 RepID=UPI00248B9720|nr:FGGY-family carbohydrate kinase [Mycolicibacterium neoaurum]WBP93310.1 FGGY-family carbohydrate kinase [Mycolicibacterium neoaurum]WBS07015.1 FGGY-family carbohydrate kinase [Mycolicibacterium neoaurum]
MPLSGNGALAIGVDLGTSSLKAVAVGADGRCVARARVGYPTGQPEPHAAEQNPSDWTAACHAALDELAQQTDPAKWGVLGLSAMLPTLVSLDVGGRPIGPAITWRDGRAEADGESIASAVGPGQLYRRTGQQFDGRYLLAMHARRCRLGLAADATVAGAKDYLFQVLTGHLLTDPSTASGFGAYDLHRRAWDTAILATAGARVVPAVVDSRDHRPLRSGLAARWGCPPGIPVLVGAADSVLGAYGLGVRNPGTVAYIAGTSNVILGCAASPDVDEHGRYLVTPMADGGYGREMDLLATGSAMEWLAGLLGIAGGPSAVADLAAGADLADAPLVLPYLSPGEQGALWDPGLVGGIEGVTLRTTAADLARGLTAGIVLESRRCLEVLADTATGESPGPIMMSGSGALSPVFRRDLADATGRAVHADTHESDHSAMGAALLAGRTILNWPDMAPDGSTREVIEPDPQRAGLWADRFARHDAACRAQQARNTR